MSAEQLQSFFESFTGQITTVIVIILLFLGILLSSKGKKTDTNALVASAILVALSVALNQIVLWHMPQGGDVTAFSMLPIVVCTYIFGIRRGLMAGMCVGLFNLIFNPFVVHPLQMILDYPMAFGALALAGFLSSKKFGIIPHYILGVFFRYLFAVVSGIIFFSQYAKDAGFNTIIWSLYYNITYLGVEGIMTVIVLMIPSVKNSIERLKLNYLN